MGIQDERDLHLDPEQAKHDLAPITDMVVSSLEIGASHTREIMDEQEALLGSEVREPHARAHMTRYFVKMALRRMADVGGASFRLRHLPNTGLHLEYGPYSAKILRPGLSGGVPEATSKARRAYYNQEWSVQYDLFEDSGGEAAPEPHRNVVYLWKTDATGAVSELHLSYPVPVEGIRWSEPIVVGGTGHSTATAGDAAVPDDFDLPIRLREEEQQDDEQSHQR